MSNKKYTGTENNLISFVTENQLKKTDIWKLFADQFIGCADTHDYGWRGEYWGKLMHGACMIYRYSKDAELYGILKESVCNMLLYADEDGRYSTYHTSNEFTGWDMWSRKYVLLGFEHFYEICTQEELKADIVKAMEAHLDYIISKVGDGRLNICDTSQVWQGVNSSSILEPVVVLYKITGKSKYLDFARYIVGNGGAKEFNIFETAFENKLMPHEYPVKKAYELMSCFEGLIEYYKVTGEEKWKTASENFAKCLIESEITIIGCAGCEHECFNNSALMQTYTKYDGLMQETCVTVTWMKLCAALLKLTGESVYADEIEKSAYNALFGAVNTELCINGEDTVFDLKFFREVHRVHSIRNGAQVFDSYSPLRLGQRGKSIAGFRPMRDNSVYSGCCIAIGAAGLGLVANEAIVSGESDVTFNLYCNGKYEEDGFEAEIKTNYPADGNVKIVLGADSNKVIKLRIPYFSAETSINVNGNKIDFEVNKGYAVIGGEYIKGDVIDITFDMNARTLRGRKNPDDPASEKHIAYFYGPLVLARDESLTEVGTEVHTGEKPVFTKLDSDGINALLVMNVDTGKETLKMIDYASAGKIWGTKFEAWIKTAE